MIANRSKICKSETPTRTLHHTQKVSPGLGMTKKSDPFLKDLKQLYDKQNINPNIKQNRVKSHQLKGEIRQKSSSKKTHLVVTNKNNLQTNNSRPSKENYQLESNSKFDHSSQLHKGTLNNKNSNRKSTEKEDLGVNHFEQQYYNKKQQNYHSKKDQECNRKDERREKKMRVTLKDVRRHRKSIQQSEQDYNSKVQQETKDSFSKDLLNSLKIDHHKQEVQFNNNKLKTEQSVVYNHSGADQLRCANHFEKKASHRLLEGDNNVVLCEKCAINLITKGHKMQQLHSNTKIAMNQEDLKQLRRNKIYGFLSQADKLGLTIKQNWSELQIYRSMINQKFQEETLELKDYYNRLKSQVQQSYQKSQMNLRIYFQSVIQEIQKNQSCLNNNQDSLQSYKKDIIPNMNSIVQIELVAQQNFTQIMQNYYKNLKEIELSLKDIAEYNYCIYQYDYDINTIKMPSLKEFISPEIKVCPLRQKFQTTRKSVQNSSEKKLDPFRLSFGKKIPDIARRIL